MTVLPAGAVNPLPTAPALEQSPAGAGAQTTPVAAPVPPLPGITTPVVPLTYSWVANPAAYPPAPVVPLVFIPQTGLSYLATYLV